MANLRKCSKNRSELGKSGSRWNDIVANIYAVAKDFEKVKQIACKIVLLLLGMYVWFLSCCVCHSVFITLRTSLIFSQSPLLIEFWDLITQGTYHSQHTKLTCTSLTKKRQKYNQRVTPSVVFGGHFSTLSLWGQG